MRKARAVFLLVSSLTLAASLPARAAGLITSLTASANPLNVNTDVTFTVKGTGGGCGDLTIDYGDGQSTQLTSVSFNNNTNTTTPPHKYATAKTYAVRAIPGKSCTGSATVNLVVNAPPSGGGTGAKPWLTSPSASRVSGTSAISRALAPSITSVFPFSAIRPGGGVIVQGARFGAAPGTFRLKLSNGLVTNLGSLQWGDTFAAGTIDANIAGVLDQPATLQVVSSTGWEGNEIPVKFTARREVQQLPMEDVKFDCSSASDANDCNDWQASPQYGLHSFVGYHACTGIFFTCNDAGDDDYWATLANGWQYSHGDNWGGKSNSSQPVMTQDEPGAFHFKIHWDTVGNRSVNYRGAIYIEGPAGTSFR